MNEHSVSQRTADRRLAASSPRRGRRLAIVVAAAALALSGCGGSGDDADAAGDPTTNDSAPTGEGGESTGTPTGDNDQLGFGDAGSGNDDGGRLLSSEPAELSPDEIPELSEPEELLPELEAEVADAIEQAAESPDVAILDVADLPDSTPTDEEVAAFGDGNQRTSTGILVVLDEPASLACANVEIALGAIDEGDVAGATDHIDQASQRSGRSEVESFESWSDALADAGQADPIDVTTLVGFLSVCIEGGYVI